jgi:hypothetical protein
MVASREDLLAALAAHGPQAGDVTDVVFSHHHPDHTVNAALFPRRGSTTTGPCTWGTAGSTATPTAPNSGPRSGCCALRAHRRGHLDDRVHAGRRVRVHPHVVGRERARRDPLGSDASALHVSREKLLSFATVIVPGHGAAFRPDQSTPR